MRELTPEQKAKFDSIAKQLDEALSEANCRLVAKEGEFDYSATLLILPTEVEMGEEGGNEVDEGKIHQLPTDCTIYNTAVNHLYEEGECDSNYF